jgi:hypothetical protein
MSLFPSNHTNVMAGPDPAIREKLHVDPRVKPGDDEPRGG